MDEELNAVIVAESQRGEREREEEELAEATARLNMASIRQGRQTVHVPKCSSTLGIAIEGGANTKQPLPRIISIQPNGAAFQAGGLRIGQLIREVDGISLEG